MTGNAQPGACVDVLPRCWSQKIFLPSATLAPPQTTSRLASLAVFFSPTPIFFSFFPQCRAWSQHNTRGSTANVSCLISIVLFLDRSHQFSNIETQQVVLFLLFRVITQGTHSICMCSGLLFYYKCSGFTLCYSDISLRLRANGRNNSQRCCANNVGSCCVRVGSGVQTDATTPNKFGT